MIDINTNRKRPLAVVILAAGQGTRMKDPSKPKVLYALRGVPMIDYVVRRARALNPVKIVAVVGYARELVETHVRETFPAENIIFAVQEPQLGTGHAMMQAEKKLEAFAGDILVLYGDVPMLTEGTIRGLLDTHYSAHAAATVLTAWMDDPAEYGRIIRSAGSPNGSIERDRNNNDASIERIVENKDATIEEKAIHEINSGIYVFNSGLLFEALQNLSPKNAQGEYYLTDVIAIFRVRALAVAAYMTDRPDEAMGINTIAQLHEAERMPLVEP